jgi:capsular polysaccharide biosynthesis protein
MEEELTKEQKSLIKRKIIIKAIPFALLIVAFISSFILLYHYKI